MKRNIKTIGKKALSLIIAIAMLLSAVPAVVFADGGTCSITRDGIKTQYNSLAEALANAKTAETIVMLQNIEVNRFNFGSKIVTLDLSGHELTGSVENATKVTVVNMVDNANTHAKLLAATGTYANDVSGFVADNYVVAAEDNTTVIYKIHCKIGETLYETLADALDVNNGTIVLVQDVDAVDFESITVAIDLNGCFLNGESQNAANVTISNNGAMKETLAATGTYANDVTAFVADGYDIQRKTATAEKDAKTVVITGNDKYKVVVVTSTEEDRDELTPETQATVDVFAGDEVNVEIRVYGTRFVAADITLTYDDDCFEVVDDTAGWSEKNNTFRYYSAKPGGGYFVPNMSDEKGAYYVLGTFAFEALPVDGGASHVPFQVKAEVEGEKYAKTFVSGSWKEGVSQTAATPLDNNALSNGYANIILRNMTVNVTANQPLTYKAIPQNVLKKGYSVKDNFSQQAVTGTKIEYAVLDKAVADGKQKVDGEGNALYYLPGGTTETTTKSTNNVPVMEGDVQKMNESGALLYKDAITGEVTTEAVYYYEPVYEVAPATPTDEQWSTTFPQATDAGDYYVYYRVTKSGYNPAEGKLPITIAPYVLTMNWALGGFEAKDGYDFFAEYDADRVAEPTANYTDIGNEVKDATVTMTTYNGVKPDDGKQLKSTGDYVYTASVLKNIGSDDAPVLVADTNYTIKNPTIKVKIDGAHIEGYTLTNDPREGIDDAEKPIKELFYDGADHSPAILNIADGATTGEELEIKYYISDDFGVTWTYGAMETTPVDTYDKWSGKAVSEIPTITDPGTYMVRVVITNGDQFYDLFLDPVTFTIKEVKFQAETFEWVAGWSVVFVYTNEGNVGFTYDGSAMYNVKSLGYKFGLALNNDGTRGKDNYSNVYGIIVKGAGNTTLVTPTNDKSIIKDINNGEPDNLDSRYNVNHSTAELPAEGKLYQGVDINDYVAAQDIYNVGATYFDNENGVVLSDELMKIVLKADVTGDKVVDTKDVALIKGYTPAQVG